MPVPVPLGTKEPLRRGWHKLRLEAKDLPKHFSKPTNIGIILGEPSGWLVEVDQDCVEARELARVKLPPTACKTGRPSNPQSHWWYVARGASTRQFRDPFTDEMIIELRSTGAQTLVGPSVHPSGERYDRFAGEPPEVDADRLLTIVEGIYKAVVIERYGELPIPEHQSPQKPLVRTSVPPEQALRRASAYLRRMPPAISGRGGHNKTYAAATVLVHGFELDPVDALHILKEEYNPRCEPPWTDRELQHKVEDAATKPHNRPRGWLLHSAPPEATVPPAGNATASGEAVCDDHGLIQIGTRDPASGKLVLSPRRTMPTAEAYVREFHRHPHGRTVHAYNGLLLEWSGNRYRQLEDDAVKHQLQPWLHGALRYHTNRKGEQELVPFESNPITVRQALDSIRTRVHLDARTPHPSWLVGGETQPNALHILPCKSSNLYLPSRSIIPATPALFTMNALEFDYNAQAPAPARWHQFLEELFFDDPQSVELLQEMFGYLLVADTSLQKMFLIVGPKRSGKGTIGRVLRRLVGEVNVAGPTISSLAGPFGLQPLIDKSLAVVSDARFTGEHLGAVTERLLCISGEDALTIERKFLPALTMKLATRMVFLTNEIPKFQDSSTALAGRFMVLRLTQSFYDKEDCTLGQKLAAELPGILNWAIEGWVRLMRRGKFLQPESSRETIEYLEDLSSPVRVFVRDRCVIAPGQRTDANPLYEAWREWCVANDAVVTAPMSFGKDLGAAFAGLRRRRGTGQVSFYEGFGLKGGTP